MKFIFALVWWVIGLGFCSAALAADDAAALQQAFDQPADNTRINVRWWWYGPAVTKPMLQHEMETMKAGGIGGFEVQPTYPLSVDGELPGVHNIKFLSPEFFDMLNFTAAKAKELGLRMDLTLGVSDSHLFIAAQRPRRGTPQWPPPGSHPPRRNHRHKVFIVADRSTGVHGVSQSKGD